MYDLILTLWGESMTLETGLSLDLCNAMIEHIHNTVANTHLVTMTCAAPL